MMLSLLMITLFVFICLCLCSADQKQAVSIKLPQTNKFPNLVVSGVDSSNLPQKSKSQSIETSVPTLHNTESSNVFYSMLKSTQEELYDCFDSIAYADNNRERLKAIVEIADRHKTLITITTAGLLLRQGFVRKSALDLAMEKIKKMQQKEIAKWGSSLSPKL